VRKVFKWIGIGAGVLVALVAVSTGALYMISGQRLAKTYSLPSEAALATPTDSASVIRGDHLTHILGCRDCHGPDLGGAVMADAGLFGMLAAPNLTTGKGGRGSQLSDADIEHAVRHGVRQDGTSLIIMPAESFRYVSDSDFGAILASMRKATPVNRVVPRTQLRILGRALLGAGKLPVLTADSAAGATHQATIDSTPSPTYGKYLANVAGCSGCHNSSLSGGPMQGPGGKPASNITPEGIGSWSESDFVRALREGKRPDGTSIDESMPWKSLGQMSDGELHSVWEFLRGVPPKKFGET
jgi:mono/diheme cytochrome c family protein